VLWRKRPFTAIGKPGRTDEALTHAVSGPRRRRAVTQQHAIAVTYDGVTVGEHFADPLVDDTILIELKTVRALASIHRAE
jgi:GxxExxY protein